MPPPASRFSNLPTDLAYPTLAVVKSVTILYTIPPYAQDHR